MPPHNCGAGEKGVQVTFKQISDEEYERLSFQERLDYLKSLQADIARKMQDSRKQLDRMQDRLDDSDEIAFIS